MSDVNVGSQKKKKNTRSRSFAATVWTDDGVWHKWKAAQSKVCNLTAENISLSLFRSAYVGFKVRILALEHDIDYDECLVLLEKAFSEYITKRDVDDNTAISDELLLHVVEEQSRHKRMRERDEQLMAVLDAKGIDLFSKWIQDIDPEFDHLAWLRRVGCAYELSWRDRVYRMLLVYFAENGETPWLDVVTWAREVGLIGKGTEGNLGTFKKLASEFGFSGAGKQGYWNLPDTLRPQVPSIELSEFSKDTTIMSLYGGDESVVVVKKSL